MCKIYTSEVFKIKREKKKETYRQGSVQSHSLQSKNPTQATSQSAQNSTQTTWRLYNRGGTFSRLYVMVARGVWRGIC